MIQKEIKKSFEKCIQGFYLVIGNNEYINKNSLNQMANVFTPHKYVLYNKNNDKKLFEYIKLNPLEKNKQYCICNIDNNGNIDTYN